MKKTTRIKMQKYAAVVLVIVTLITLSIPNYANAVSSDGFLTNEDITPPNDALFELHYSGIVSNPDNIQVFAVCANVIDGGYYYGTLFCTKNPNYNNLVVRQMGVSENFSNNVKTVTYNNNIYYINYQHMSNGKLSDNKYSYAEFGNNGDPLNNVAQDFYEYVNNNSVNESESHVINYSLPAGNIAIIETDSSYSYVNLTTTMPLQSTSFSSNPWPNTTQRIGYYGSLPQTLNPNSMGNVIEWQRNGNTTLFNITTSAKYNPSVVSSFKYVVIANPYYYPANDMEDRQFTNGAINISMDGVVNIIVKNLTATVNTQTGEVENNYNGDEWTGEVDDTTNDIIWTDSNGDSNAPTNGGNLSDPSITGFQSWLKGILNNIVNIFEPAHDAIGTLSGAVRNFASWMYALYVWLPSPILSLLTSAISLAIVIGIIKVFI